jgi:hypothetical protein
VTIKICIIIPHTATARRVMPYSILLCHIIIVYLTAVPTNSTLLHGERDVTSQRVEIAQGMQVTIACRGGSSRDWKNGSESITTSPFKNVFQSKQSNLANLVIKSMSFAYVGVYTCHVSMDNVPDATVETVTLGEFQINSTIIRIIVNSLI